MSAYIFSLGGLSGNKTQTLAVFAHILLSLRQTQKVQTGLEKCANFQLLVVPVIILHLFTFVVPLRCHTMNLSKHADMVMKT